MSYYTWYKIQGSIVTEWAGKSIDTPYIENYRELEYEYTNMVKQDEQDSKTEHRPTPSINPLPLPQCTWKNTSKKCLTTTQAYI